MEQFRGTHKQSILMLIAKSTVAASANPFCVNCTIIQGENEILVSIASAMLLGYYSVSLIGALRHVAIHLSTGSLISALPL